LKQVMRHDNQLLELATELRRCIKEQDWESPLGSNHDDEQGVWFWGSSEKFERQALARFKPKEREVKIIAWRNKTVERYNMIVRSHLGFRHPFCVDDVLLLAEPIERDGHLIAHTDDEFLVTGVDEDCVNTGLERVDTWRLAVDGDQTLVLQVPRDEGQLQAILSVLAGEARQAEGKHAAIAWKKFWTVKRMFQRVRYGYALTAHRAQGSTYDTVFVDQLDILANQAKKEAFKCLYVATTRASRAVHSF
jgi:exodeoxyribonuclease-5